MAASHGKKSGDGEAKGLGVVDGWELVLPAGGEFVGAQHV